MRIRSLCRLLLLALPLHFAGAQGTVPTFLYTVGQGTYAIVSRDPEQGSTTTIHIVLVPVTLSFDAAKTAGRTLIMDAAPDVPRVLRSPVFSRFAFPSGGATQYADAMLRTTFRKADAWHTLLGKPELKPVKIIVPAGYAYILTSKKTGDSFAVVDIGFLQKELFRQLPKRCRRKTQCAKLITSPELAVALITNGAVPKFTLASGPKVIV
jgi:chitinase